MQRADVVVVGGGVIGLAAAWRCAQQGLRVCVVDPQPGRGASWAAAGMLAPVTEAHHGEEALLALNLASWRRWDAFAADLSHAAGRPCGYWRCGTLAVALDAGDRAWLEDLYRLQVASGLDVQWLSGREARAREPDLAPGVCAGMVAAGDHQVDNRQLIDALLHALERGAVTMIGAPAESVDTAGGAVCGVRLADGGAVEATVVVLCAASATGALGGLPPGALPTIRPVKGQILRLAPRRGGPALRRSVRGIVEGQSVYLVPRRDGSVVVGATVEEMGFDTTVTAGAVHGLLRDARRIVPAVGEMALAEATAGLRPATDDNGPVIGPLPGLDGLVVATGHYRNGILLAPITADAVVAAVAGTAMPDEVERFGPERWRPVPC